MKDLVWSALSAGSVLATYCVIYFTGPENPEYAGSGFSWTVTHFFPAVLLSTGLWIGALSAVFGTGEKRYSRRMRVSVRLLLLPYPIFVAHVAWKLFLR